MIRGIIFDFGNVICSFDFTLFLRRVAEYAQKSPGELKAIVEESQDLPQKYEEGLITSEEFYRGVSARFGVSIPRAEFRRAFTDIFTPIPSTFALVQHLKLHYRIGLLSNTNEWHYLDGIRPVSIFPLFDAVTLSFEVKALKPAAAIYRDALTKIGLPASACLYIDDLADNVQAATALGLHAVQYTSYHALLDDMTRLGIHVPPSSL